MQLRGEGRGLLELLLLEGIIFRSIKRVISEYMEAHIRDELCVLDRLLQKIIEEESVIQGNFKIFAEAEILDFISNIQKWTPKIRMLIKCFENLSRKYGRFAIRSMKFVIDYLLLTRGNWFQNYIQLEKNKCSIITYMQSLLIKEEITFARLRSVLQLTYQGISLFFDKDYCDMQILEAFLITLGEYKGKNLEDCIKTVWIADMHFNSPLQLLNGLVLETNSQVLDGLHCAIHYSESNFIIGIPNSMSSCSENSEFIELNPISLQKYAENHKSLGITLVICQKVISPELKKYFTVSLR